MFCCVDAVLGDYMLTITKREQIGTIQGKAIYRVGGFQILPLAQDLSKLTENQVRFYLLGRGEVNKLKP